MISKTLHRIYHPSTPNQPSSCLGIGDNLQQESLTQIPSIKAKPKKEPNALDMG
jgi:hypothetical protein